MSLIAESKPGRDGSYNRYKNEITTARLGHFDADLQLRLICAVVQFLLPVLSAVVVR